MGLRPYAVKSIQDLEERFDLGRDDPGLVEDLLHELSFRKTRRAQALAVRARARVAEGAGSGEVGQTDRRLEPVDPVPEPPMDPEPLDLKPVLARPSVASTLSDPPPPVSRATPRERPAATDHPKDILAAWTAMEVLSPSVFRKPDDLSAGGVAPLDRAKLPWVYDPKGHRKDYRLYYQVVLGSVLMEPAVSALLEVYADRRPERPGVRGEAVLASVMVDKQGRLVETDAVVLSSFAWAVPQVLAGNLKDLGRWSSAERDLTGELTKRLTLRNDAGEIQPLTAESITRAYRWLVDTLGLKPAWTHPPLFAVRTYQYFKVKEPPEALILNSFFLDDLSAAEGLADRGALTGNLRRYLGEEKPGHRQDLLHDHGAVGEALRPSRFPLGGWPGMGRHPLALLQQCAVNLALEEPGKDGILAVNGPPGTGKTTLLRDVIAGVVTERAGVMASIEDPQAAFAHSGEKIQRGKAFIHLYSMDECLRGFEMIVASSNNKAVENVSAELPSLGAVADDAPGPRYFSSLADRLLKKEGWGVIAAVLGNASNRAAFKQDFWWDKDGGLQTYLKHASGTPQMLPDPDDKKAPPRLAEVVTREDPPLGHAEALVRWRDVRARFLHRREAVKDALAQLEAIHDLDGAIRKRRIHLASLEAVIAEDAASLSEARALLAPIERDHAVARLALDDATQALTDILDLRPGWLRRLFRWAEFRAWRERHAQAAANWDGAQESLEGLHTRLSLAQDHARAVEARLDDIRARAEREHRGLAADQSVYADLARSHGGRFIDEAFFALGYGERHLAAPWLDDKVARLRQDLFDDAMAVHKAFIDVAAKPIRHNLNALMDSFGARSLGTAEKDALIPALWATLFLVVPVVSTTFASVSRMFGRIGSETFGWLLIDEAGQALPQAAVGALTRTRRALVVGDPIQIEPVVALPNSLTEAICGEFGIEPLRYNAPEASAQTLADAATAYFASFETQFGTREVGVPLLVHRRCADPMFSVSNAIAYENLMVQAKRPGRSAIREALGPSSWFHVDGEAQDKWCPEEGRVVLDLLRRLRNAGCDPDVYVVTPFVAVRRGMIEVLRESRIMEGWVDRPEAWINGHVGTVHTVQGREAEAVIFILGAPLPDQQGARGWAGGQPNLLNVAATRAKEVLYVVGNRDHWKRAGVFAQLNQMLT